jgi:hypothetical protein
MPEPCTLAADGSGTVEREQQPVVKLDGLDSTLLPLRNPAINTQILPSHIRTRITGKKNTSTPDILRHRHPSIHNLILPTLQQLWELYHSNQHSSIPFLFKLTGAVISVLTYPGLIELTLIPYSTNSFAIPGTIALTAPLVPQYALLL